MRAILGSALILVSILAAPEPASTQGSGTPGYTITDLGGLGGRMSVARGLNNAGEVVGYARVGNGGIQAFLYSDGRLTPLGTLGGTNSYAYDINDLGMIVGRAETAAGTDRPFLTVRTAPLFDLGAMNAAVGAGFAVALTVNNAGQVLGYYTSSHEHMAARNRVFLYKDGTITDLGTFGGEDGIVTAINTSGQVAGHVGTEHHADYADRRAFFSSSETTVVLPTFGGAITKAFGLNNSGQVVGFSQLASGQPRAFVYSGGAMTDLGVLPGGTQSIASAINDAGEIVGASDFSVRTNHAFIHSGGAMRDLNALIPAGSGWVLTQAFDINEVGQIVGSGVLNGEVRAFLLTRVKQ